MNVIIEKDYESMSIKAANIIRKQIEAKPDLVIGLATGSTPINTYKELIRMHKEEGLDFSQVSTFNLDEYYGISIDLNKPYEEDQSYARFMYEELFKHINIKKENIYVPDGLTKDHKKYCKWYEEKIKELGGIDLQLLGLGGDGHWGFNEPGSSLKSRTRLEALTEQTLNDNYESFYKKSNIDRKNMPHFALTMGIGTILEAKEILMIVNGSNKAEILAKCLEGPVTSQVTSSAIQLYDKVINLIIDEGAASKLKNRKHYDHVQKIMKKYKLD